MTAPSRRELLKGIAGVTSAASLTGCTFTAGGLDTGMPMDVEGVSPMFKGAPAHGEYPAETETIEHHMPSGVMRMEAVSVAAFAATDDSNNYHFMPHVVWIEPGQTVAWEHLAREGVSERRTHTMTSFGSAGLYPSLIPEEAEGFDSGFRAGTHGVDHEELIDERFNREMQEQIGQEGMFTHQFDQEGVYMYYCQPHHDFGMAGAVVVGELWGEDGEEAVEDPEGWSPAMTADVHAIEERDPLHGETVVAKVHELRELVRSGGEMMEGGGH